MREWIILASTDHVVRQERGGAARDEAENEITRGRQTA
jgi:hypothetical protein